MNLRSGDQDVIDLTENKPLPGKEIAHQFPERSANTLQVHCYTKLKNRDLRSEGDIDSEK